MSVRACALHCLTLVPTPVVPNSIGAGLYDAHAVQVHPTGIVNPADPDAKVKFLAAEALRGAGALLLDNQGHRFADELGKRDYVSGRMWSVNKAPYRLVLNSAASAQIAWHCEHYASRGACHCLERARFFWGSLADPTLHLYTCRPHEEADRCRACCRNRLPCARAASHVCDVQPSGQR